MKAWPRWHAAPVCRYRLRQRHRWRLGAYEATPLEVAGAYTIFSHQGLLAAPNGISRILDRSGRVVFENRPAAQRVLDQRVAYLMVDLMQSVLDFGTGAAVSRPGLGPASDAPLPVQRDRGVSCRERAAPGLSAASADSGLAIVPKAMKGFFHKLRGIFK